MLKDIQRHLLLILCAGMLFSCSDSESPQEKMAAAPAEEKAVQLPVAAPEMSAAETVVEKTEEMASPVEQTTEVVESKVEEAVSTAVTEVKEEVEAMTEAVSSNKPYQVVDGNISANAIEGWKTFNGGGCGACHGQGASGGVGPNLGESVTKKLTKEQFVDVVTNGRAGTFMKSHKNNKRVMDNLDNLYAYFMARGDGVLGPENLIKFPMGKQE